MRHSNKLKLGHLAGNRFVLKIRGVPADAGKTAGDILTILSVRGVPNLFGPQRYGIQGNSHLVGRALLAADWKGAVDAICGTPETINDERWRGAIVAYSRGDIEESISLMP